MFKTFAAATATVVLALGLSLAAVAPASAEGDSNSPSFYVTPNTSEVCAKWTPSGDTTTVTAASFSIPAGATLTKVIIKAGNTGAGGQGPENHGYYTDATYQYPAAYADLDWEHVSNLSSTTFSHPSGKNLSHAIYCYVPAPAPTDVAGAASATNPVCTDGNIVSGFITVTITTGVTYVITDSSNNVIQFDGTTGKTGNLPGGSYTVAVSASSSAYNLTSASSIPLTIAADPTDCGSVDDSVAPAAVPTGQTCSTDPENAQKVPGFITLSNVGAITYTITRDSDSSTYKYDSNGKSDPLEPGAYTVHPEAKPGKVLSSTDDIHVTVTAFDGNCQLPDHALVTPQVQQDPGCSAKGTYTLSNNLSDPAALTWTVNGLTVAEGVFKVNTPATVVVHAAANGPAYGLASGAQTDWTLTFASPATCGDLKTLALTGTDDGMPMLATSGLLLLLGAGLIRSGVRLRRTRAAS